MLAVEAVDRLFFIHEAVLEWCIPLVGGMCGIAVEALDYLNVFVREAVLVIWFAVEA